jgi:hypothetical protein
LVVSLLYLLFRRRLAVAALRLRSREFKELETEGDVPGLDEAGFRERAEEAKTGCIVSRALGGVKEINLVANLSPRAGNADVAP